MKKTKLDTRKLPPEFLRVVQAVVKRPPERKGKSENATPKSVK